MSYVYAAWPTSMPLEHAMVKIGSWTGSLQKLRSRYVTPYGSSLQIVVYQCASQDVLQTERLVQIELKDHHLENELFRSTCLDVLPQVMERHAQAFVTYNPDDKPIAKSSQRGLSERCEDHQAVVRELLFKSVKRLEEEGCRPSLKAQQKAILIKEVLQALGFRDCFDTGHAFTSYEPYKQQLLQTTMFREYRSKIQLFDKRARIKKTWSTKDLTESVKLVLGAAGIAFTSTSVRTANKGIRSRVYTYSIGR